ncbi:MAG: endopeptidase La [Candidatus Schekmanbacteria bacterium]|nr:endopeptidase La [Candidatus Schekmanbacteria bacterium]
MTLENTLEPEDPGTEAGSGPEELPILPIRGTVLYPRLIMPMVVGRRKSVKLINEAMRGSRLIGIVAQRNPEDDDPEFEDLYSIGCAATILKMIRMPQGELRVIVQGLRRVHLDEVVTREPYWVARVTTVTDQVGESADLNAVVAHVKQQFQRAVEESSYLSDDILTALNNVESPGGIADLIAFQINAALPDKQAVLESLGVTERLNKVALMLAKELELIELSQRVQSQVKDEMSRSQREHLIREQMKALQRELGEEDDHAAEITELQEKIEKAGMPEDVKKEADRELKRLSRIHPSSAEYTVARTYLDWLTYMPWAILTEDVLDIAQARRILNEDHYDLEKVKKRILEYLAVRKLKSEMKGPILCFVGPPGVGKTSLGKSIARAMERKFIRISLGGVRDEAEVRGHRRTYIGALPGRIIQGIRKAGSRNPVFMLDEVDKMSMDFRGDPSAALLEVLDPEQNHGFSDHYLDVAFDLSKVLFIATANFLDPIPPALLDRMEVIRLPGYTSEEKVTIAKTYLVTKQLEEHGLTAEKLELTDDTLRRIVSDYTKEAGVRNFERRIAAICRAVAMKVAEGEESKQVIEPEQLFDLLGPQSHFPEVAERTGIPGVATGLAWTAAGGEILFIEATRMPGKGVISLTGQLGDVMKESAHAALSYLRSRAQELGIDARFLQRWDLHIHIPSGAIPKDGPSAGITLFSAVLSLLTGWIVRKDFAMTGEISLRGLILPVGGIKEKVLAAKQAGIPNVLLPELNRKDLEEVGEELRKDMIFHFAKNVEEAMEIVFDQASVEERKKAAAVAAVGGGMPDAQRPAGGRRRRRNRHLDHLDTPDKQPPPPSRLGA